MERGCRYWESKQWSRKGKRNRASERQPLLTSSHALGEYFTDALRLWQVILSASETASHMWIFKQRETVWLGFSRHQKRRAGSWQEAAESGRKNEGEDGRGTVPPLISSSCRHPAPEGRRQRCCWHSAASCQRETSQTGNTEWSFTWLLPRHRKAKQWEKKKHLPWGRSSWHE